MSRPSRIQGVVIGFVVLCGGALTALAQQPPVAQMTSSGGHLGASTGGTPGTAPGNSDKALVPYAVGSGDVLNISVWQEKELSSVVTVRPDGNISMPLVGEIMVIGMTPIHVQDILQNRLESVVKHPRVTVTVVEIHSRMVYVTGEVTRPGAYPLNGPLNVLQLIAQAGGLTQFASRSNIRLLHSDRSQPDMVINYSRVLKASGGGGNPQLLPGDTVVVK